jgi:hypothetical protein
MTNQVKAALAASLITFGGLCVLACAPAEPETPLEVEAPADPATPPCGGTVSGETPACQEQ